VSVKALDGMLLSGDDLNGLLNTRGLTVTDSSTTLTRQRSGVAPPPVPSDNNRVDDWAESNLAWKLADAISASLADCERAQLYAVIGSGDSYSALTTMLRSLARDAVPVSANLKTELGGWLNAYRHSADAPRLHELLSAVPLTTAPLSPCESADPSG
jgi:hypothetical protein